MESLRFSELHRTQTKHVIDRRRADALYEVALVPKCKKAQNAIQSARGERTITVSACTAMRFVLVNKRYVCIERAFWK